MILIHVWDKRVLFPPRFLTLLALGLATTLLASLVLAAGLGAASIPVPQVAHYVWAGITGGTLDASHATTYTVVWDLRIPRSLLAAALGAGLALVGVVIQVLVRNALADPFILGISSGASVGASAVVSFGVFASWGIWALSGAAFAGALVAAGLVWLLAGRTGGLSPLRLVLVGVVLGLGFQAAMSLIVFFAPRGEAARAVLFWLLGSLGGARWEHLPPVIVTVAAMWLYAVKRASALDVLAMGDDSALSLGLDVKALRRNLFLLSSLVAGVLVAACGAVGFVGLVVPHVIRMWLGPAHRPLLIIAPLAGGVFCVWADVLTRTLVVPRELPLGVITAFIGVPVFLTMMHRHARQAAR